MDFTLLKIEGAMVTLVPFAFYHSLACAQTVDPTAILAGGALRDLINHAPVKDLDIFVGPGVTKQQLDDAYGVQGRTTIASQVTEYLSMADVEAVYEHAIMGIGVINTVVLNRPMSLAERLSRFDFGICQVAFDGQSVWATTDFHKDRGNQTFTLVRCDSAADHYRSMLRWDRLVQKYPHWQLVTGNYEHLFTLDLDELEAA